MPQQNILPLKRTFFWLLFMWLPWKTFHLLKETYQIFLQICLLYHLGVFFFFFLDVNTCWLEYIVVLKIKNLTSSLKLRIMHASRNVKQEGALPQLPMLVLAHHSGSASPLSFGDMPIFHKSFHCRTVIDLASRLGPHEPLTPWLLKMLFGSLFKIYLNSTQDHVDIACI